MHDFMRGVSVENIAIKGRWSSVESIRHYITNARGWLTQIDPSNESNQLIKRNANSLQKALDSWRTRQPSSAHTA